MICARNPYRSWQLRTLVVLAAVLHGSFAILAPAKSPPAAPRAEKAGRLIHHFDFDERAAGNLESLPRYWLPLQGDQFPRFTEGGFDNSVGRSAPPSFRLESMGRNVAYQYIGDEIPVRTENEYRVQGFMRAQDLRSARVCISACFLDEARQPILETTTRSPYLAPQSTTEWTQFDLQLPAAPARARFLGLVAWILQDATWNEPDAQRISLVDVHATAWFDDISIFRLPRVELETRVPGNVLLPRDSGTLWITLADPAHQSVVADLQITAADGSSVLRDQLEAPGFGTKPIPVDVSRLPPGVYDARVEIAEAGNIIVARALRFAKIASSVGSFRRAAAFGIALNPDHRAAAEIERSLLDLQPARGLKIPISAAPPAHGAGDSETRSAEKHLYELLRNQFFITGCLFLPDVSENSTEAPGDLVAMLAGDRAAWESAIAEVVTPAANLFRWWQLGLDDDFRSVGDTRLVPAAGHLREVLGRYMSAPRIAATVSAVDQTPEARLPFEQITLTIPPGIGSDTIRERIAALKEQGYETVAAQVPPLPKDRFVRENRLSEWARRILVARHSGADIVYVPQPWHTRSTPLGTVVEPDEEYLLYRTMAEVLGDTPPDAIVPHEIPTIRCLAFRGAGRAVVAVWDESPSPARRLVPMQLGASATRAIDLWGQSMPLRFDGDGRQLIEVSTTPILIDQVAPMFIDLARSISIEPSVVESGTDLLRQDLVLNCAAFGHSGGSGVVIAPHGIEVSPRSFSLSDCSEESLRIPLQVHYGHGESAGDKLFTVRLSLDSPASRVEVPLRVRVQLSDIEVSGRAVVERGDLLLRHTLRNHTQNVVHFRSIAGVPGRERQYRPIASLEPGESQTIEYRFRNAGDLIGRHVTLALRELNDGPRQHNLDIVVP